MVHTTSTESGAYLNTSATPKTSSNNKDMSEQIERIQKYFDMLDGSPDVAKRFPAAFRDTFHPDCIIEFPGGEFSREGAIAAFHPVTQRGGYADLEDIFDNGDGTVTMSVNNHIPEGSKDDVTHQIGYFKDGKLIRVRAIDLDREQFGAVMKHCVEISTEEVAEKYKAMIACFDGSPNAYEKAEPILNEIFDKNLVINHGAEGKSMDFDAFKAWAATFSKERNVAKLEEIESSENEIRVTIRNIVGGVDQGPVGQVGDVRNGQIFYWSADASEANASGFDNLISSVATQSERMTDNIQRFRDYLAATDGSPDAWERVEPLFNRVYAPDIVWDDGNGSELSRDEIVALLRDKYIPNGCYPVLESVEDNKDGSLTVVINNHLPGEEGEKTKQVLLYRGNDDLIHRISSSPLYEICKRVNTLPGPTMAKS